MARTQQSIDTLEAKAAELRMDLARLEAERAQAHAGHVEEIGAVPPRSLRRATSRRASKRRAEARALKADTGARIVEFVGKHPGSTAGEVAKGLDLNRSSVSNRLTQLAKLGHIRKADRGYAAR
ncbi:MAG: helix-turn-helix domain-containing protein [Solirubrobacteraceae bacterium]|jgi:DNA-binding CsgD family transcriptional regulator